VLLAGFAACAAVACQWDPSRPFERESPEVKQAIGQIDAGEAGSAAKTLEEYLSTGACSEGNIGTPDLLKRRADGTFDLGLSLFTIAEGFGRRFGEEEVDAGVDDTTRAARRAQIDCALRVVKAIAGDPDVPLPLRAHARYLEGNLDFLDGQYEDAVKAYDEALALTPARVDAGDPVSRDAAWNRAIALRRIEDKKDAGQDAANDGASEGGQDGGGDGGPDGGDDSGDDAGKDSGGPPDAGEDGGNDGGADSGGDSGGGQNDGGGADAGEEGGAPPQPNEPDAGREPPPRANQDDRILDMLENAPTLQQEAAKRQAGKRRGRGMVDK
jgi:hypothetical protein